MLASGKAIDSDSCYVIGSGLASTPYIIPSIYAVEVHYELPSETLGKRDTGYFVFQTETKVLYFDVYSIETGKKIKSINVKGILQEKCPELQVPGISFNEYVYQGKPCMTFVLEKYPDSFEDGLEDTLQDAYLSLDSEELFIVELSEQSEQLSMLMPMLIQ